VQPVFPPPLLLPNRFVVLSYHEVHTKDVLNIELMVCKGYLLFVSSSNTGKRIECEQNNLCRSPVEVLYNAKHLGVFWSSNKN